MRIPKPKFTLRQLILFTAFTCLYLALWRQTKYQGYCDFEDAFGHTCYSSPMPLVLIGIDPHSRFDDTGPIRIGSLVIPAENRRAAGIGRSRRLVNTFRCYVWLFGHTYRTPVTYERPMPMLMLTPGSVLIPEEEEEPLLGTLQT